MDPATEPPAEEATAPIPESTTEDTQTAPEVAAAAEPRTAWADVADEACDPAQSTSSEAAGPPPDGEEIPKLFVAPISRTMTVDELKKVFEDAVGPVQECTVLTDKATGTSRGCAFVTMCSKEEASQAIAKLHMQITLPGCEKPFEVLYARTRKYEEPLASSGPQDNRQLFFARAKFNTTDEEVKEVFSQYGEVEEVLIFKDKRTGQSKPCGFVRMATRQQALDALNAVDGKVVMEGAKESMSVKWADMDLQDKKKKRGRDDVAPADVFNTQMFFGRASKTADEAAITTMFSQYGRVKEVLVFKERGAGQSKGCGFVTMSSRGEAEAAMAALNGTFTMEGSKDKFSVQWADLDMQHRKKHVGAGAGGYPMGSMMGGVAPGAYGGWAPQPYGYGGYPGAYDPYGYGAYAQHPPQPYGYNQSAAGGGSAQACKLYIGCVPHAYTEKELTPVLQPYGNITNLHILYDKSTGTHKGAAFCTYSTPAECDQAIAYLHQKYTLPGNSKPIIVKYAGRDRVAGAVAGAVGWEPQSYQAVPAVPYGVDPYAQQQQQPQPQPMVGYDQYQTQQYAAYAQQPQYAAYAQQPQYAAYTQQPQYAAYAQQPQ
eukprot:1190154-Prorocentrum_minimum.AAC.3